MGLGTWIANLVTAGEYTRRGRLLIIDQEFYKSEKRAIEFLEMGLKDYGGPNLYAFGSSRQMA